MTAMTTVWETEDQRLILVHDECPLEPYDDGSSPVIEWGVRAGRVKQSGPGTSYKIPSCDLDALRYFLGVDPTALTWKRRDREDVLSLFARWLHIYRGVTTEPLVRDESGEYVYISYCPSDWRDAMGLNDEYLAAHPDVDIRPDMTEWVAYLEGDVYGAVLQRRETWTDSRGETRDEWETEDSVWGFYGAEWAEDGALGHFPNPLRTCRHCGRVIIESDGLWVDPEATGDDAIWRETCDSHDTFVADHEPTDDERVAS